MEIGIYTTETLLAMIVHPAENKNVCLIPLGSRAIAGLLGISRNSVKGALASDRAPQYEWAKLINPEIEPWVQFATEGYLVKHLRVSRILADLCSKGLTGGSSALYRRIEEELKPRRRLRPLRRSNPTRQGRASRVDTRGVAVFEKNRA
jgi:hypothetical protein